MKAPSAAALALAAICAAACKPEVVNRVELTFEQGLGPDSGLLPGFSCDTLDAGCSRPKSIECLLANEPLADKVLPVKGGSGHVSLVVDFIGLGGNPRCDATSLAEWCGQGGCSPLPGTRVCVDVPLSTGALSSSPALAVSDAVRDLGSTLITPSAPTVPVIVRVIATAQSCDGGLAGTAAPDCADVVGCAVSCPVELGSLSGPLELAPYVDIGVLGTGSLVDQVCAPSVALCAQTPLGSAANVCQVQ